MANLKLSASYREGGKGIEMGLSLYSFDENGLKVIYAPALDLYGYGSTEQEARNSFAVSLDEFIKYAINKGTLESELSRLGWNVGKAKKKIANLEAPDLNVLLRDNETFSDIYHNKTFQQESKKIALPELV